MTKIEQQLAVAVGICEYCKGECCNCNQCVQAKGKVNLCGKCKARVEKIHAKA